MNDKGLLRCPVCARPLIKTQKTYVCEKGHSFDISSHGYVNLLTAGDKNSRFPGDDKQMASARHRFLSGGYYAPLAHKMERLVIYHAPPRAVIIDAGCGEGYYTSSVCAALKEQNNAARIVGFDISKFILKYASKRAPDIEFAVASSYRMPVNDECADILINCFSPLALEEFRRVLKPGGIFIYVVPGREHLFELKEILYDKPYENEEKETPYEGFLYESIVPVKTRFMLSSREDIADLFKMTPYYWKTPRTGRERLAEKESLWVTAAFNIHVFKKTGEK
ncbi:MAG: methyltransferase domain-containing protein [Clostridia bacterium]|nr:methyltransferase domain-containing protein [Clostridia bacterium]